MLLMTEFYRPGLLLNSRACIGCQVNIINMRFIKQPLISRSLQTIWRDVACTKNLNTLWRNVRKSVPKKKKKREILIESDCFGQG